MCTVFYRAAFDSGVLLEAVAAEDRPSYMSADDDGAAVGHSSATIRSRQHFPETWLWHNQWTEYCIFCLFVFLFHSNLWGMVYLFDSPWLFPPTRTSALLLFVFIFTVVFIEFSNDWIGLVCLCGLVCIILSIGCL